MKKRILFTLILCALVIAVLVVPSSLFAGEIRQFSGNNAYASFSTSTSCSQTYMSINASESKVRNPPGRPGFDAEASVLISVWNSCDNTQVYGSGFIPLGKKEFQIDRKLNSATLNTKLKVDKYQWVCDGNSYPICENHFLGQVDVSISLSWNATGGLSTSTYTDSYQSKFCKSSYSSTGSWRPAQASGSVSDGTINFTQSTSATLANSTFGQREIGCN